MNEILTPILAQLTRGDELSADAIDAALGELFEGRVSDVQAAAFIVALRTKGETEAELVALVRTMHRFGTPVEVPDGAIDTCGTGGDRSGTVNVSTMAALIAAGAGARVVKHGNRAASSQAGSADVLEELGVAIDLGPRGRRAVRRRSRASASASRRATTRRCASSVRRARRSACRPPSTSSARSPTRRGCGAKRLVCPTRRWRRACSARCARSAPNARWSSPVTTASTS